MSKISDTGIEEQQKSGSSESGSVGERPPCARCGEDAGQHPEFACERYIEPGQAEDSTPPEATADQLSTIAKWTAVEQAEPVA